MTGVLIAVVLCGLGVLAHSVYALASARREPTPFVVASSAPPLGPLPNSTAPAGQYPSRRAGGAPAARSHVTTPLAAAFVPARLQITGLHVDAPVVTVLSAQHTLAPPENPRQVGWWVASAPAGAVSGSTVIVGHIDSAASGRGALFSLDHAKAGQIVALSNAATVTRYRVTSLQYYRKSAGLPTSLFTDTGPARLVLISCGGTFDPVKHSYRSNVVVTAEPVPSG